jgi:transposase
MKLHVALDVSLAKTAVLVMDQDGHLVRDVEVPSCPDALAALLRGHEAELERVGMEASPMSEWLVRGLAEHGIDAVLMETRQARKALSAMTVKTDRNDARGLAQLLRMGRFRPVHVKATSARGQRARLAARTTMLRQTQDLENSLRGLLRGFGLRVPTLRRGSRADAVRALVDGHPNLPGNVEPLPQAREALHRQLAVLDRQVRDAAREDAVCRHLMTVPGVGAVVALTFRSGIDDPAPVSLIASARRLPRADTRTIPSAETNRAGAIGKVGDATARVAPFETAHVLLSRVARWSALTAWGMRLAQRRGAKPAKVALARKLATVFHRMWISETDFHHGTPAAAMEG